MSDDFFFLTPGPIETSVLGTMLRGIGGVWDEGDSTGYIDLLHDRYVSVGLGSSDMLGDFLGLGDGTAYDFSLFEWAEELAACRSVVQIRVPDDPFAAQLAWRLLKHMSAKWDGFWTCTHQRHYECWVSEVSSRSRIGAI